MCMWLPLAMISSLPVVVEVAGLVGLVGREDCVVVRLGAKGKVSRVLVDTRHFLGNVPRAVRVEGCAVGEGEEVPR